MPASSNGSGPIPPSAPSSAPSAPTRPEGWLALAFAIAAAASSWNPLGAPFAAVTGVGAVVLALRALRGGRRRWLPATAAALGGLAVVASVLVLLASVGVGHGPEHKLGVEERGRGEVRRVLDEAASRTQAARERAARELSELPAPEPHAPAPDGPPKRR